MTPPTSASPELTCYIRRTREWAERYEFSPHHSEVWHAQRIAEVWDATFNMTYVDFRWRLNRIQIDNLADVGFDLLLNQYDYQTTRDYGWVVPTDDDDWFHPDLREQLQAVQTHCVYWNFINYSEGVIRVQESRTERVQFESNNYAMRWQQTDRYLADHATANYKLKNTGQQRLACCLSLHNRSLASLGLLNNHHADLRTGMLRLYDLYRQPVQIVGDVPTYFMPYVERMQQLYQTLQPQRTMH